MTVSRATDDLHQVESMMEKAKAKANPMCEDGGRAEERPGGTKRVGRHDATIPDLCRFGSCGGAEHVAFNL